VNAHPRQQDHTGPRSGARAIAKRTQLKEAIAMRASGASLQAVVDAGIGYKTIAAVSKAIKEELARNMVAEVDTLREMMGYQLDQLLMPIWLRARRGELDAIDRAVKILDQKAKLFGLNAPQQVEQTFHGDVEISADFSVMESAELAAVPDPTQRAAIAAKLDSGEGLPEYVDTSIAE
jgi:hypothetical protein